MPRPKKSRRSKPRKKRTAQKNKGGPASQPAQEQVDQFIKNPSFAWRHSLFNMAYESEAYQSAGPGKKPPKDIREQVEGKTGADLSDVRVHNDKPAAKLNRLLGARGFAKDNQIFLDEKAGKEHPSGMRGLLAHELTHSAQQKHGLNKGAIQRADLKSNRLSGYPMMEAAFDGVDYLQKSDKGYEVEILQKALVTLGFSLPEFGVDGDFGGETKKAVIEFQTAHKLGKDGIVGPNTLGKMDELFLMYEGNASEGSGKTAADVRTGSHSLSTTEKDEIRDAITATGGTTIPIGDFDPADKAAYKAEIEAAAIGEISSLNKTAQRKKSQYSSMTTGEKAHLEVLARQAQSASTAIFGGFARNPGTLSLGSNLNDFTAMVEGITSTPKGETFVAERSAREVLNRKAMNSIDEKYSANRNNTDVDDAITELISDLSTSHKSELIDILTYVTPGSYARSSDKLNISYILGNNPEENRKVKWKTFQSLLHEYMHMLAHSNYHDFYEKRVPNGKAKRTYREGVAELLTMTVWNSIDPWNPTFRELIEGIDYDAAHPDPIPAISHYPELENALALQNIVGINNIYAAYFLGEVDKISYL